MNTRIASASSVDNSLQMQLHRTIRALLAWTHYKMAKALKMSQTSYTRMEDEGRDITGKKLALLQYESGLDWRLIGRLLQRDHGLTKPGWDKEIEKLLKEAKKSK